MSLDTLIRDVQNHLGLVADGKPGPLTWAAIHERIAGGAHDSQGQYQAILAGGTVDKRSESNIITLHPRVQAGQRPGAGHGPHAVGSGPQAGLAGRLGGLGARGLRHGP